MTVETEIEGALAMPTDTHECQDARLIHQPRSEPVQALPVQTLPAETIHVIAHMASAGHTVSGIAAALSLSSEQVQEALRIAPPWFVGSRRE